MRAPERESAFHKGLFWKGSGQGCYRSVVFEGLGRVYGWRFEFSSPGFRGVLGGLLGEFLRVRVRFRFHGEGRGVDHPAFLASIVGLYVSSVSLSRQPGNALARVSMCLAAECLRFLSTMMVCLL